MGSIRFVLSSLSEHLYFITDFDSVNPLTEEETDTLDYKSVRAARHQHKRWRTDRASASYAKPDLHSLEALSLERLQRRSQRGFLVRQPNAWPPLPECYILARHRGETSIDVFEVPSHISFRTWTKDCQQ